MLAVLFLILAVWIGYILVKVFLPEFFTESRAPRLMLALPAAFAIGVIVSGVLSYFLCVLFAPTGNGMAFGSAFTMAAMAACVALAWKRMGFSLPKLDAANIWQEFKAGYMKHVVLYSFFIVLAVFLGWFFFYSFFYSNGRIAAGYSVYSDFGPHVALIRSFSRGNNFPAQYPHFPDGTMRYHFMFQYYTGILEFLGMRIDIALNALSLMSMLGFLSLLYVLAIKLVEKQAAGLIAIILFLFRSSFAIFTFFFDGTHYSSLSDVFDKINENIFIGNTSHEDWGLWNINVYANQRHFALGLSLMLVLIIAFLPLFRGMRQKLEVTLRKIKDEEGNLSDVPFDYDDPEADKEEIAGEIVHIKEEREVNWLLAFFVGKSWLPKHIGRAVFLGLFVGAATYFHGSCVTAALGILAIMALFSEAKLDYAITAAIALGLSFIQNWYFVAGASMISPRLQFGFIVENPTALNVAKYLIELTGIVFFVALAGAILKWKKLGGLALAFLVPAALTFTLSLTPDITVNHKFLMMSIALLNIFAAYAIVWVAELFFEKKQGVLKAVGVAIAGLLVLVLTSSGIKDLRTYIIRNGPHSSVYYEDKTSDIVEWITKNTEKGSVFLSSWHVQSPIMLAGRFEYQGWPYFTWSAGYEENRGEAMVSMFSSESAEQFRTLVQARGISYVYVDRDLIGSSEFPLNEEIVAAAFPLVYSNIEEVVRIYEVK